MRVMIFRANVSILLCVSRLSSIVMHAVGMHFVWLMWRAGSDKSSWLCAGEWLNSIMMSNRTSLSISLAEA